MPNSNTNALIFAGTNSSICIVCIGKYSPHVILPKMASMNIHSWKKSESFNTLQKNSSLLGAHTVADLISLVSDELLLDSGATFQEAQTATKLITDNATIVTYLEPLAFITSTTKVAIIGDDLADLEMRPEDITFLRFRSVFEWVIIE